MDFPGAQAVSRPEIAFNVRASLFDLSVLVFTCQCLPACLECVQADVCVCVAMRLELMVV